MYEQRRLYGACAARTCIHIVWMEIKIPTKVHVIPLVSVRYKNGILDVSYDSSQGIASGSDITLAIK